MSIAAVLLMQSQQQGLPAETPAQFKPVTDSFDYVRQE